MHTFGGLVGDLRGWAATLLLAVITWAEITTFVVSAVEVRQVSMSPTVEPLQRLVVDKLTPALTGYARGDIVVFAAPAGPAAVRGERYIKRVVGLPGDRIELRAGAVFRNGERIDEPYLIEGLVTDPAGPRTSWTVGPSELFVLGDHRDASIDSRAFGAIRLGSVEGRVAARYFPLDAIGRPWPVVHR